MPRTSLCDLLGIEHPILSVGFGPTAGPELVAAVSAGRRMRRARRLERDAALG